MEFLLANINITNFELIGYVINIVLAIYGIFYLKSYIFYSEVANDAKPFKARFAIWVWVLYFSFSTCPYLGGLCDCIIVYVAIHYNCLQYKYLEPKWCKDMNTLVSKLSVLYNWLFFYKI